MRGSAMISVCCVAAGGGDDAIGLLMGSALVPLGTSSCTSISSLDASSAAAMAACSFSVEGTTSSGSNEAYRASEVKGSVGGVLDGREEPIICTSEVSWSSGVWR